MAYKYDQITHIEDDIEKIQTKPGMYMSYLGNMGARHLAFEIINNAFDECINKNSPANMVEITYDKDTDILMVSDNGRGIPPESMRVACTKINAGSKFTREQSGTSAGENGCGLTCVNAMSSMFRMTVYNADKQKQYVLEFSEGKEVDYKEYPNKTGRHGTVIENSPSVTHLGKGTRLPYTEVIDWIDRLSYQFTEKIKVHFVVFKKNKVVEEYKFKTRPFADYLSKNTDKRLTSIMSISGKSKFKEEAMNKTYDREASVTFSFCYSDTEGMDSFVDSYCNYINTIDGGSHVDAVKTEMFRYLQGCAKKSLNEREKGKLDILFQDVQSGFNLIVNLNSDVQQLGFTGQTKQKIQSDMVYNVVKDIVSPAIDKYFKDNPEDLDRLIKIVKINAKARFEMNKAKSAVIKESTDIWKEHKMKNFVPANNRGKQYKEIFIVEGESAKGSAEQGRDPDTQALFAIRGVSANAFKRDSTSILENNEFRDLIKVLKCNIGPKFDLSKLAYDKVIIMTDADIDGFGIRSLLAAFFIKFLPEIVKSGKLYVAVPPLYEIKDKKNPFVIDKRDFVDRYIKIVRKMYDVIELSYSNKKLDSDEFYEFIYDTKDYSEDLKSVSEHFKIHKRLIELVTSFIALTCGMDPTLDKVEDAIEQNQVDFISGIQKVFPELTYSNMRFSGVIDGKYKTLDITQRFLRKLKHILPIFCKHGCLFEVIRKDEDKSTNMSLSEFIDCINVYRPEILGRFKGLGENDPTDLWRTTLNPDSRTLIKLEIDNYDDDMEIFAIMHDQGKKYAQARKTMMKEYTIDRDDLDN